MATVKYKIFKHHRKSDGKYNVKICLTHKGKQVYYSTTHHASDKQIKRDMTIKDNDLLKDVIADVGRFEKRLSEIGHGIDGFDAAHLLKEISRVVESKESPDFVQFCIKYVLGLESDGRHGYARLFTPLMYNLIDFFGDRFPADAITSDILRDFEGFISKPRTVTRPNKNGTLRKYSLKGLKNNGAKSMMDTFRVMFNKCRKKYNTEKNILIPNQPFDYYTMPKKYQVRKIGEDISIDDIISIKELDLTGAKALGRDMFLLSFYLCGINLKDIFDSRLETKNGRLDYNRAKTRGRREDNARFSVRIPDEAKHLVDKYGGGYFNRKYASYRSFNGSVGRGLIDLSEMSSKWITVKHARHVFATLAHVKCGFTKEEISKVLNHIDPARRVTEFYISDNWSVVDKVQSGVLGLLTGNNAVKVGP